ncbi:MAG: penicillin acylase family protein, partial [Bacteroidia bacterium]|nr:penicillin acylase family protein [Bacteroidia bacterium]MDW8134736.1 penicillin acylase family protein [Bacteroidia bacterium]
LIKYMAYELATRSQDKYLSQLIPLLGEGAIDTLFPNEPPLGYTTIVTNTKYPLREIPPQPPELYSQDYSHDTLAHLEEEGLNAKGSNNWAVSGKRTLTGYPLLANDPHLSLTLPSIWVEMHLVAPHLNVYGVTLMGAPGIIIGYNEAIAWGVTNVGNDAMDFYHLHYGDSTQTTFYYEGKLIDLHPRPETLWTRSVWGGEDFIIDTVYYSPWGPVVHRSIEKIPRPLRGKAKEAPIDCALRWVAYEPSNEARCFYEINRAKNLEEFKRALIHFGSPAQNFVYADTFGNIAMWVRGYYPLRWKGQGKFVLEAEESEHHWRDWLKLEENPHEINPIEGFVRSANGYPAGRSYPYYLGWYYVSPDRTARIEEYLRKMYKATPDSFRLMQLDVVSFLAQRVLPIFLFYTRSISSKWLDTLKKWDCRFAAWSRAPTLFKQWWRNFHRLLWRTIPLRQPEWEVSLKILEETHKASLQNTSAPYPRWLALGESEPGSIGNLIRAAWEKTENWAERAGDTLLWWRYRSTQIRHLARLPGFGSDTLRVDGEEHCINAIGPVAGPSWRMVVSLMPPVQGYGVYPGGQSGNPGSFHYAEFIPAWEGGQLYLHYFIEDHVHFPQEAISSIMYATSKRNR